jgi:hypothetical protein
MLVRQAMTAVITLLEVATIFAIRVIKIPDGKFDSQRGSRFTFSIKWNSDTKGDCGEWASSGCAARLAQESLIPTTERPFVGNIIVEIRSVPVKTHSISDLIGAIGTIVSTLARQQVATGVTFEILGIPSSLQIGGNINEPIDTTISQGHKKLGNFSQVSGRGEQLVGTKKDPSRSTSEATDTIFTIQRVLPVTLAITRRNETRCLPRDKGAGRGCTVTRFGEIGIVASTVGDGFDDLRKFGG